MDKIKSEPRGLYIYPFFLIYLIFPILYITLIFFIVFQIRKNIWNSHFQNLLLMWFYISYKAYNLFSDSTPSPYGGLNPYGGISPGYVPNLSPQNYMGLGPTPPPPEYSYNILTNNPNMPGSSSQLQLWNSPSTSSSMPGTNPNQPCNIPSTVSSTVPQSENLLLDLDSRELNINSDEIDATLKTMDMGSTLLPEIENLSFSDPSNQDQNMTDSLTTLANNTLDSICQLNNMYPPQ